MSNGVSEHPRSNERPFLQTMPGILAGIAAIITALGALVAVFVSRDDGPSLAAETVTTIASPSGGEGSVVRANISWKAQGPRSLELNGPAREVWAHFRFGVLPAPGRRLTVVWRDPDGKSTSPVEKPRAETIDAVFVSKRPLVKGRWHVYLRVGDQIVYDLPFRISGSSRSDDPIQGADG